MVEGNFRAGNNITSIQCPILDLYINSDGVIPENRLPAKRKHSILKGTFYWLTLISVENPWESTIECGKIRWILPAEFSEVTISLNKKLYKNIVVIIILVYPDGISHNHVIDYGIDYPI